MRILIAEDDVATRLIIERSLRKMEHDVVAATNGLEAREHVDREQFPVVISDIRMPLLDGFELCRYIRSKDCGIYTYVMLLTALDSEEAYIKGIEAGADDFLRKPFSSIHIRARLHAATRIVSLNQRLGQTGPVPSVCAWCNKIQDEESWLTLDAYLSRYAQSPVSHGMCPDCFDRLSCDPNE